MRDEDNRCCYQHSVHEIFKKTRDEQIYSVFRQKKEFESKINTSATIIKNTSVLPYHEMILS